MALTLEQEAFDQVILKELSSTFIELAEAYAESATAEDLAILYAIVAAPEKSAIEVLNQILANDRPSAG